MKFRPEEYWPERYERQGDLYVSKFGRRGNFEAQMEAIPPYFERLPKKGRVLDFGCGPGRFRPALEARGLEYEGVDLVPGLGTMDVDEIKPASFDCATAIFVLQHIVDEDTYRKTAQLLHGSIIAGGTLLVVDHFPREGMDEHMEPRGSESLFHAAPWYEYRHLGKFDGHWIGLFVR